jgi:hypothetical protein
LILLRADAMTSIRMERKDFSVAPTNPWITKNYFIFMKKTSQKKLSSETKPLAHDQMAFEQAVSQRAYQIWEDCGCPHGDDTAHWLQAERDVRANNKKAE